MEHIVWDWNGTLFHDLDAVIGATNEVFQSYGLGPYDVDSFRESYTRPIWVFYERILGRPLNDGEWEALDRGFHEHYHRLMDACKLAEGAAASLREWDDSGRTQSLLSMWTHDRLVQKIGDFGIESHFTRVDGLRSAPGGTKAKHMVEHIMALDLDPTKVVVIGDSVDDAHAAHHVGARAILYTGGMTTRVELERVGVPVVDYLAEALDMI